ncbi:type I toxin-antitoxin system Fst family toxin [Enterococcus sp. BWB1-3]|nr:type I toxin-antitoxin system Fst family toxin [Enterococcus sp. BWB1-3]MBL1228292.1 type I toxin-antitoxin system Fst family toxin [Enterococcus sp. BWB1-3]
MDKLLSLVIAPIFVGIVIQLVSHWLDEKRQ